MTARHGASRRKTLTPAAGTDAAPRSYVDAIPTVYRDTDGTPYLAPNAGAAPVASTVGSEIAYAMTRVRTSCVDAWTDVEGLELTVATPGPVRLVFNLGLVVMGPISLTVGRIFEYRVLDVNNQTNVVYGTMTLPATTDGGFTSSPTIPLSVRLSGGLPLNRFVAQIKAGQANTPCYVTPEWLPNAISELYMMGI